MGLFDFLSKEKKGTSKKGRDWDQSVFDTDRFKNKGSSNWVDQEDVCTGSYNGDGFDHPKDDPKGEW